MVLKESRHSTEGPVEVFLLECFPSQSKLPAPSDLGRETRRSPKTWHEQSGVLAVMLPADVRSPNVTPPMIGRKVCIALSQCLQPGARLPFSGSGTKIQFVSLPSVGSTEQVLILLNKYEVMAEGPGAK